MPNCRLNFWLFSSIGCTKEESYNTWRKHWWYSWLLKSIQSQP